MKYWSFSRFVDNKLKVIPEQNFIRRWKSLNPVIKLKYELRSFR